MQYLPACAMGNSALPRLSEDILEGITRNALIDMVRDEFGYASRGATY